MDAETESIAMNFEEPLPEHFEIDDYLPFDMPEFQIGQIIRHKRYRYRAIVVDFDMACRADDEWYLSNQTRPERQQPWYHLLVDSTHATTYAAQEYLMLEKDLTPVQHPLISQYFDSFEKKAVLYERNDEVWPGW